MVKDIKKLKIQKNWKHFSIQLSYATCMANLHGVGCTASRNVERDEPFLGRGIFDPHLNLNNFFVLQ